MMHHVPQAGLTALAVAGPVVQRGVRHQLLESSVAVKPEVEPLLRAEVVCCFKVAAAAVKYANPVVR